MNTTTTQRNASVAATTEASIYQKKPNRKGFHMYDTAEMPVKASAEIVSPRQVLLEAADMLNKIMQLTDNWYYQAMAITRLADQQKKDEHLNLFPEMVGSMSQLLGSSIQEQAFIDDCHCLIISLTTAAERASGLPAHS